MYNIYTYKHTYDICIYIVHIFSNIFRSIDDLCTFNNDEFESGCNDIYPDELDCIAMCSLKYFMLQSF